MLKINTGIQDNLCPNWLWQVVATYLEHTQLQHLLQQEYVHGIYCKVSKHEIINRFIKVKTLLMHISKTMYAII